MLVGCLVLAMAASGCAAAPTPAPPEMWVRAPNPIPTAPPLSQPACGSRDGLLYSARTRDILSRFSESIIANNKKAILAEMVDVDVPACAMPAHALRLKSMEEEVAEYTALATADQAGATRHGESRYAYATQSDEILRNGDIVTSENWTIRAGEPVAIRRSPHWSERYKPWPGETEMGVLRRFDPEWMVVQAPDGYIGFVPSVFLNPATPTTRPQAVATRRDGYGAVWAVDWTWSGTASGRYLHIKGTLENTNVVGRVCILEVVVSVVDAAGNAIGTDSGYDPSAFSPDEHCLVPGEHAPFALVTGNPAGTAGVRVENVAFALLK